MAEVSAQISSTQTSPDIDRVSHLHSLPPRPESNSHGVSVLLRGGSWNSFDTSSHRSSQTLKRKAGSPNLSAATWNQEPPRVDPFQSHAALDSGEKDASQRRYKFPTNPSRSANIHSFAFDFDRYFEPIRDTRPRDSPLNHSSTHIAESGVTSSHQQPEYSRSQAFSPTQLHPKILEHGGPPASRVSRNAPRSVPARSVLSDASTPSLSRFPLPPTSSHQTDPNSSEGRNDPGTPTIYHFRGTSFEFVNPRSSLRLQNIETPAEQETDKIGYFQLAQRATPRTERVRPSFMAAPPTSHDLDKSNSRATPPRSLFDDLPSAYNSIRKTQITSSPLLDLPLPPPPMPSQLQSTPSREQHSSTENLLERGYISQIERPSPVASFRQRFSQVFRLKGRDTIGSDVDRDRRTASQSALTTNPGGNEQRPSSVLSVETERAGREGFRAATSGDNDHIFQFEPEASRHYYDDPSFLDHATSASRSNSRNPVSHDRGKHGSSNSMSIGRDDFTEDFFASYGYEFDKSARSSAPSNLSRPRSMPLFRGRPSAQTINKQADSTIGEILEQYRRQDESSSSQADFAQQINRRASMPAFDARMARPESGGDMSGFDFGLAKEPETNVEETLFDTSPDIGVRAATARALSAHGGPAPLAPLPVDPSNQFDTFPESRQYSGNSSSLSATSYDDTRRLLLLSQPSIELGRGASVTYHGPHDQGPSVSHSSNTPYPSGERLSPMLETISKSRRTSERSYEDIASRDLKYLSRLSGLSNFQGSVYMVGSASSVQAADNEKLKATKHGDSVRSRSRTHKEKEFQSPTEASWVPIAAFQQSSVVPGICRLPTLEQEAFEGHQETKIETMKDDATFEQDDLNLSEEDTTDDPFDWETIPESRITHESQKTDDSFAEWSSYSSLNTFRNVNVHPGDSRLQHGYRLHSSENLNEPVLVPSYEFRGGGPGFPNRNALTPPAPAIYNTYKHPLPLCQTHENPFTSSPPQITGSGTTRTPVFGSKSNAIGVSPTAKDTNIPLFSIRRHNLSIVAEQHVETPKSSASRGRENSAKWTNRSQIPTRESSGWLSSEPGPEISLEAEHGSPAESESRKQRLRSTKLSSGVDPGLVHILRQGDPRMASSPLSPTNSFAKLSRLGPKGNITGTPNGTGMREVGSSLIGSSSPAALLNSSPPEVLHHTPITEPSTGHCSVRNAPMFEASSPLAKFNEFQHGVGSQRVANNHQRGASFRDALIADSHADRQARRAVTGQKELIHMTLNPNAKSNTARQSSDTRNDSASTTNRSAQELLPLPVTSTSLPKLRHRYRSPSSHTSATRERKQKISWVCFALCAIFPFTLILYGHGVLDTVIVYWTNGDIRHFGHRQKRVAKILGWGAATTTILTIVILFAVIRTVPNDYPR